jgi:hypothetical protein
MTLAKGFTLGPAPKGQNGLSAFLAPTHATIFHSLDDEDLASCLDNVSVAT